MGGVGQSSASASASPRADRAMSNGGTEPSQNDERASGAHSIRCFLPNGPDHPDNQRLMLGDAFMADGAEAELLPRVAIEEHHHHMKMGETGHHVPFLEGRPDAGAWTTAFVQRFDPVTHGQIRKRPPRFSDVTGRSMKSYIRRLPYEGWSWQAQMTKESRSGGNIPTDPPAPRTASRERHRRA